MFLSASYASCWRTHTRCGNRSWVRGLAKVRTTFPIEVWGGFIAEHQMPCIVEPTGRRGDGERWGCPALREKRGRGGLPVIRRQLLKYEARPRRQPTADRQDPRQWRATRARPEDKRGTASKQSSRQCDPHTNIRKRIPAKAWRQLKMPLARVYGSHQTDPSLPCFSATINLGGVGI